MSYGTSSYGVAEYAVVHNDHAIQVGIPADVICDHLLAISVFNSVTVDHSVAVGFTLVTCDHSVGVGVLHVVEHSHSVRVGISSAYVHELVPSSGDPASNYYRYGSRLIIHDSVKGDKDITQYVTGWSVSQSRGTPTTFSVDMVDKDRKLRPYLSSGDEYYDLFSGANFNSEKTVTRYLTIEVVLHDQPYTYPYFLITDYDWSLSPSGVPLIKLAGSDYSELLTDELTGAEDYVSGPDGIHSIRSIVAEILSQNNIPASRQRLEFTDMLVHRFSPSSTPLDSITDLLYYIQAEWYWDRDVFVAHDRNYAPTGSGYYRLVDTSHILDVGIKRTTRGLFNEFTGTKAEAFSSVLAENECRGGDCLGQQVISFETAAWARLDVESMVCGNRTSTSWFLGGIDGKIVNPYGTASGGKCDTVAFVYEPFIPFLCGEPYYKVRVVGRRVEDIPPPAGFESSFQCVVRSTTSQDKYGVRRDSSPITSTVWATASDCERTLRLLMEESARTMFTASVNAPLLPGMIPARTIKLVNGLAGSPLGENYYIEDVNTTMDSSGVATSSMTLTRYRPEDL